MAFLDNSGDIILDAVLTDTGRQRLARGDGSFRISKFALGDDEIDYGLYNKLHASGSAYYDLEILQTPVLEAFTNNMSSMKSKLMSISRTNLLYMPILKKFEMLSGTKNSLSPFPQQSSTLTDTSPNQHVVMVDQTTRDNFAGINSTFAVTSTAIKQGLLDGFSPANGTFNNVIEIHQGIDNSAVPDNLTLSADLVETQYIVEMDDRLGALRRPDNGQALQPSYIDDDSIASYFITTTNNAVQPIPVNGNTQNGSLVTQNITSLAGAVGTAIAFKIKASIELQSSSYLFDTIGQHPTSNLLTSIISTGMQSSKYLVIDSIVRVTGVTTGYSMDIPVRYIKFVETA